MGISTIKRLASLVLCVAILCLSGCAVSANTRKVRATVVDIEKYGHVVLDVTASDLSDAGYTLGDLVHVRIGAYEADMPFFDGYYSNPGTLILRGIAPDAPVAICINYGHFSQETGTAVGDIAEITLAEKGGMLVLQELCSLQYSNDRADYSSDAVYANFRAVTAGGIGSGKLYRSASPIDNLNGRAGYANDLIEAAKVATVLNLADSREDIEAFFKAEDFRSEYYLRLYEAGNVIALDLGGNIFSESFAASIAEGLTLLAQKQPPYSIHCLEGKDRAGFTVALVEALMGADLEEITTDYMLSYYNYYGVDKELDPLRYQTILDTNLTAMLCHVAGVETSDALVQVDWEAAATKYLLDAGMAGTDITTLKEKLR